MFQRNFIVNKMPIGHVSRRSVQKNRVSVAKSMSAKGLIPLLK
jgi:hypothetical protein